MRSAVLLMTVGLLATGCHAAFEQKAPSGYVELARANRRDYDFRAVSADGAVLAVRELDREPPAELAFWSRAIANAMRRRGGYALLGQNEFTTATGLRGHEFKFGHDEQTRPHLYYLAVVLTDSKIYLLEAGGAKALVETDAARIDSWLRGFRAEACAPFPFAFACRTLGAGDQPPDAKADAPK